MEWMWQGGYYLPKRNFRSGHSISTCAGRSTVTLFRATDQDLRDLLEAEIAVNGPSDIAAVSQAMEALENANLFFPTDAAQDDPFSFPILGENMMEFCGMEQNLQGAPIISPFARLLGVSILLVLRCSNHHNWKTNERKTGVQIPTLGFHAPTSACGEG